MNIDPKTLPGIVLDDTAGRTERRVEPLVGFKPHIGTGYLHDDKRGDGQSIAIFRFKAPKPGKYDLRMAYSAHETRATKVPVTIETAAAKPSSPSIKRSRCRRERCFAASARSNSMRMLKRSSHSATLAPTAL
jgi:hypothetical protein